MLWLYLLAAVTVLVISLRRVLLRQAPLSDELYSSKVALEHVHSGVCWVRADGQVGFVNHSLAESFGSPGKPVDQAKLVNQDWYRMFPAEERAVVQGHYEKMLLAGIATLDTHIQTAGGAQLPVNVRLVAVHDHKMRLVGHHCMIHDESRGRNRSQDRQAAGSSAL